MEINFPLNFRTHSDVKQKLLLEKGHFTVKVSVVSSAIGSAFHLCWWASGGCQYQEKSSKIKVEKY